MIPVPEIPGISLYSLLHFVEAILWAVTIFVAIAGYGGGLLRGFGLRRAGLGLAATAGFVPVMLLGGVLNLLHLIETSVLVVVLVVGIGLAAWTIPYDRPETGKPWNLTAKVLLVVLVLAAGFRVGSTVHSVQYLQSDDLNYYLAAPVKMLETHSFGADPFSERRVTSTVGGSPFLGAMIVMTQPVESVQMSDWALGVFLTLVLGFAIATEFELTTVQTFGFGILLMAMPQVRLNISPVVLPAGLFLGLVYVAAQRRLTNDFPWLQAVLLGGIVGVIAALKGTCLPHAVIFIGCVVLLRWWKRGFGAAVRLAVVAAVCAVLTMLPWMIANLHNAGTLFFPLAGKGFDYSAYGMYPSAATHDLRILTRKVLPFCAPFLVLFGLEMVVAERDERSYTAAALMLAAFGATLVVGFATGGDSMKRYNAPCFLPAICLVFVVCARRANLLPGLRSRLILGAATVLVAVTALTVGLSAFTYEYRNMARSFRLGLVDYHVTNAALREEYGAMQRSVPAGATLLENLTAPFVLDFSGPQNISLGDMIGAASPRPGWPVRQSGDALAQFLLANGVEYLAYGYGECNPHPASETCQQVQEREDAPGPNTSQLVLSEMQAQHDAVAQFAELAETRRRVYDDGRIWVIDLRK